MSIFPAEKLTAAVENPKLQTAIYDSTARLMYKRKSSIGTDSIDEFKSYREQVRRIKQHTIENLDYYLEQLESNVIKNGGKVVWARDADDAVAFVRNLCKEKGVKRIVKSKSMTTEEI